MPLEKNMLITDIVSYTDEETGSEILVMPSKEYQDHYNGRFWY